MNLESGVLQVHIEDIIPNRFQPRLAFDEQGLKELADSIREHGIIQPLVLRKLGNKYEIIAGERRYKAAQLAGLTTVPAVISNIDDNKSAEVALVENVQRRDLTAIEEARSYKNLLDKGYLTQEQLAKRMGLSQPAIANKLRLLNLDEEVQQALLEEKISERHARTLLSLNDKQEQKEWLHRIINERLTVRTLDQEIKNMKESRASLETDVESTDDDSNTGEVPVINNIPSLEDIKANAIDIREANKIAKESQENNFNNNIESLELFDLEETKNSPVDSNLEIMSETKDSFTTATKVPEFNIATPNSASSFVSPENLIQPTAEKGQFFNFDNVSQDLEEKREYEPVSQKPEENKLEIFDMDLENKSVAEEKQINPINQEIVKPVSQEEPSAPIGLSSNKFFTPIYEPENDIIPVTEREKDIDPMSAVDKLVSESEDTKKENSERSLKTAITDIRRCIQNLGDRGYYINVEEIDFDSNYQITIKINKDN